MYKPHIEEIKHADGWVRRLIYHWQPLYDTQLVHPGKFSDFFMGPIDKTHVRNNVDRGALVWPQRFHAHGIRCSFSEEVPLRGVVGCMTVGERWC